MLELCKSVNICDGASKINYLLYGISRDLLYVKIDDKIKQIKKSNCTKIEYVLSINLLGEKREVIFSSLERLYSFERYILLIKNMFNSETICSNNFKTENAVYLKKINQ